MKLVYFHKGDLFPEYIYDSIYQTIIWNHKLTIWILSEKKYLPNIEKELSIINNKNNIQFRVLPIEIFEKNIPILKSFEENFRGNFWNNSLIRFFYIYEFIKFYNLENIFHIENDVMIYSDFYDIYQEDFYNQLVAIQDSNNRAICSYMYIHNYKVLEKFLDFIKKETLDYTIFKNDMELMGLYKHKKYFNNIPKNNEYLFDGAAIGQYLGGVDPRNIEGNTKGFINETSIFKPNLFIFEKQIYNNLNYWICKKDLLNSKIANLHIHSKNLCEFSSDINIENIENFKVDLNKKLEYQIITGENILKEMDVVFVTNQKYFQDISFFKNTKSLIIKISDEYKNLSFNKINIIKNLLINLIKTNKENLKVFVYGDNLLDFYNNIFDKISADDCYIPISLYVHNSDENFYSNEFSNKLLNNKSITSFFCQNLSLQHPKANILPIGIANSIWKHGSLDILKKVLYKKYKYKKQEKIYVNFNEKTYPFRKIYKSQIKNLNNPYINLQENNLDYEEYLEELIQHKYSFCPRGNGLDTHRFWECIYLGVIPIIIDNKDTCGKDFVENLKKLDIKFHVISNVSELNNLIKNEKYIIT